MGETELFKTKPLHRKTMHCFESRLANHLIQIELNESGSALRVLI